MGNSLGSFFGGIWDFISFVEGEIMEFVWVCVCECVCVLGVRG